MLLLDLFAGIGMFSLGLERAGFMPAAFCEIDPDCRTVLGEHYPLTVTYNDVKELNARCLLTDGIVPAAICGGFPCQDISFAGEGRGLEGKRSRLFWELLRLVSELRPRWVIIENTSALLARGLDQILVEFAQIGYDAEWHCIPASVTHAPHLRDRCWIMAYPGRGRREVWNSVGSICPASTTTSLCGSPSDADSIAGRLSAQAGHYLSNATRDRDWILPDTERAGLEVRPRLAGYLATQLAAFERICGDVTDADIERCFERSRGRGQRGGLAQLANGHRWPPQPGLGGMAPHGAEGVDERLIWFAGEPEIPRTTKAYKGRVQRIRALGNSLVPVIPEMIGHAIMEWERCQIGT